MAYIESPATIAEYIGNINEDKNTISTKLNNASIITNTSAKLHDLATAIDGITVHESTETITVTDGGEKYVPKGYYGEGVVKIKGVILDENGDQKPDNYPLKEETVTAKLIGGNVVTVSGSNSAGKAYYGLSKVTVNSPAELANVTALSEYIAPEYFAIGLGNDGLPALIEGTMRDVTPKQPTAQLDGINTTSYSVNKGYCQGGSVKFDPTAIITLLQEI